MISILVLGFSVWLFYNVSKYQEDERKVIEVYNERNGVIRKS